MRSLRITTSFFDNYFRLRKRWYINKEYLKTEQKPYRVRKRKITEMEEGGEIEHKPGGRNFQRA